eukprot:gene46641-20810_t
MVWTKEVWVGLELLRGAGARRPRSARAERGARAPPTQCQGEAARLRRWVTRVAPWLAGMCLFMAWLPVAGGVYLAVCGTLLAATAVEISVADFTAAATCAAALLARFGTLAPGTLVPTLAAVLFALVAGVGWAAAALRRPGVQPALRVVAAVLYRLLASRAYDARLLFVAPAATLAVLWLLASSAYTAAAAGAAAAPALPPAILRHLFLVLHRALSAVLWHAGARSAAEPRPQLRCEAAEDPAEVRHRETHPRVQPWAARAKAKRRVAAAKAALKRA